MEQNFSGIQENEECSLSTGYIACLAYDDCSQSRSRYFRMTKVLSFTEGRCYLTQEAENSLDGWHCSMAEIQDILTIPPKMGCMAKWSSKWTKKQYLGAVERCQADIRNGRYYQINLLQYYHLENAHEPIDWFQYFQKSSGPLAAWIRVPDLELISFSPERFFRVLAHNKKAKILAQPIKGTSPVYLDECKNEASMAFLKSSEKDQAELHMIVDLMRNDLNRISIPGTVTVSDPGSLHSFSNVHHLIASVEADLHESCNLAELLKALAPGGSITGAPKLEVMGAITEYEGTDRGFYMGNICYFDPHLKYFDSSILIRTVCLNHESQYSFAAGSGLTINSIAESEWGEIQSKASLVIS